MREWIKMQERISNGNEARIEKIVSKVRKILRTINNRRRTRYSWGGVPGPLG